MMILLFAPILAIILVALGPIAQVVSTPTEDTLIQLLIQILQPTIMINAASVAISLCATYIPNFRDMWESLKPDNKAFWMFVAVTGICLIVGAVSWSGFLILLPPGKVGVLTLLISWISALIANQGTYSFTKSGRPGLKVIKGPEVIPKEHPHGESDPLG